jgi:hypothetical protein
MPHDPDPSARKTREITRAVLLDRIRGGWTGMLIGGLEGLPHEFKYLDKPRDTLPDFPMLPGGATTDDDNDFEWTHLYFMDKEDTLKIPYPRIVEIWKANMNAGLWVANKKARDLMDQGLIPPQTGDAKNNPAAWFNLSGQFCVESYGMVAPGMPQAGADLGLHYAKIAVSGEPLQATQYWTSLISVAAVDDRAIEELIRQAAAGIDPASAMAEVVKDALQVHADNPADWKKARQAFRHKWIARGWNGNSTPTNGGLVLLALLYGEGDFYKTLQYAMALGEDADCNAATAGTVVGCRIGYAKIAALPGFTMPDFYVNKTRPQLPKTSKVSDQAQTLLRIAEKVIMAGGGRKIEIDGQPGYRIVLQDVKMLEKLPADAVKPPGTPAAGTKAP